MTALCDQVVVKKQRLFEAHVWPWRVRNKIFVFETQLKKTFICAPKTLRYIWRLVEGLRRWEERIIFFFKTGTEASCCVFHTYSKVVLKRNVAVHHDLVRAL